jgi:hypothetical protein
VRSNSLNSQKDWNTKVEKESQTDIIKLEQYPKIQETLEEI